MKFETLRTVDMPWVQTAKSMTPPAVWQALYRRLVIRDIPEGDQYHPHFQPWRSAEFGALFKRISPFTQVPIERCWTVWQGFQQTRTLSGDVIEAGVFQGGTARLLREAIEQAGVEKSLLLFDSFEGMAQVSSAHDRHAEGDFADTSLSAVQSLVGTETFIEYYKGWIPATFAGLENRAFAFAHIDLDLFDGITDTLSFVYPRMPSGGVIVFDDYGLASCPGARRAVESFFADKPEKPFALLTAQAIVHKL